MPFSAALSFRGLAHTAKLFPIPRGGQLSWSRSRSGFAQKAPNPLKSMELYYACNFLKWVNLRASYTFQNTQYMVQAGHQTRSEFERRWNDGVIGFYGGAKGSYS